MNCIYIANNSFTRILKDIAVDYSTSAFFTIASAAALHLFTRGVDLSEFSNADLIKAYFIATKQHFDANQLVAILNLGGVDDVSKSFARAMLNKKQLEKYKRQITRRELTAFFEGISTKHNINAEALIKALNEQAEFSDIIAVYNQFLGV